MYGLACEQRGREYPNYCGDRAGGGTVSQKKKLFTGIAKGALRTSSDHTLNVSISVAAHTPDDDDVRAAPPPRFGIQPVCEMLLPRLPTYTTASSSSCSFASEMHTSPSVDPESRR
jgi:hypothetical protein